jgi:hypothetical protein
MQKNTKNKISFFSFGLLAGITIGVIFGVAIKAVLGHLNDMNLGILKIGSRQQEMAQRLDSIEGKIANQSKKNVLLPTKNIAKGADVPTNNKVTSGNADNVKSAVGKKDSVATNANENSSDSNVVIMTNQLVSVSNVSVVDLDSSAQKQNRNAQRADSAISAMNEIPQEGRFVRCRVEYWQSPLNFRGYKMSLGKIVLYGINSTTPVKLMKLNDEYYLISSEDVYAVNYTDDLRPFDRVTDKTILKRLAP